MTEQPRLNVCTCGNVIHQQGGRGRPKLFCSPTCRTSAYEKDREARQAKARAYYWQNREARLAYQQEANRAAYTRTSTKGAYVLRMFDLLVSESQRQEYAEWILFLIGNAPGYGPLGHQWDVDDRLSMYVEC
jgi:hypothetical protein